MYFQQLAIRDLLDDELLHMTFFSYFGLVYGRHTLFVFHCSIFTGIEKGHFNKILEEFGEDL